MEKNELQKIWELPSKLPYRERVEEIQRMFTNDNKNLGVEIRDGGEKVYTQTRLSTTIIFQMDYMLEKCLFKVVTLDLQPYTT